MSFDSGDDDDPQSARFPELLLSEWVSQKVLIDIREKLMEHITSLSLDYFNESRAGNLLQRIINETREVQSVFTTISTQLISQPATLIAGLFVLIKIDWRFTIGALILFPCVIGPLLYLGKKIRQSSHNEDAQRGEMMVILHEMLAGSKLSSRFPVLNTNWSALTTPARHNSTR